MFVCPVPNNLDEDFFLSEALMKISPMPLQAYSNVTSLCHSKFFPNVKLVSYLLHFKPLLPIWHTVDTENRLFHLE